jgi:tRNA A-37 threonylcarbamoyl transferase component Bud32
MSSQFIEGGPSWDTIPSTELEQEHRVKLAEFRSDLNHAKANGFEVLDIPALPTSSPNNKPLNTQLEEQIEKRVVGAGQVLYLSPEYSWLQGRELEKFQVLRSARAETSAHGVFFGLLRDVETGGALPIAVKPCKTPRSSTAFGDWLNNNLIARSDKTHFESIGVLVGEGVNYSLTELKRGVDTLDNTNWNKVLSEEHNPVFEGQREELLKIGPAMARLHAQNMIHGDTQFKNIAVDLTGNIFFIDWESASFYAPDVEQDFIVKKMAHDLEILFRSMAASEEKYGVGLLNRFSSRMQWEHFKSYIFDPYMEEYLQLTSENENGFERISEIEEKLKDYIFAADAAKVAIANARA